MHAPKILVLGHHARRDLVGMLCGIGLEPEVWNSIPGILERLGSEQWVAVLSDRWYTRVNALDAVLSVREANDEVPVVLLGSVDGQEEDSQIHEQKDTVVITENLNMDTLSDELLKVLRQSANSPPRMLDSGFPA